LCFVFVFFELYYRVRFEQVSKTGLQRNRKDQLTCSAGNKITLNAFAKKEKNLKNFVLKKEEGHRKKREKQDNE